MTAPQVPDPPTIDGAALLDAVAAFLTRFVAYPSEHARVAHALWITHTHLMDAWESTPRIAFLSPEPGSGKTRAGVEVTELLVPSPIEAVNVTPAYLFRKIGECSPTILYDEIDTVFGPKAKDNEEIRGLLNAGHRRGAVAGRCVVRGKIVETEEIPAYCAVALVGLGGLPDTLLSRSVVIRMRKRAPGEHVEEFRRRVHAEAGNALRDRLTEWADSIADSVSDAWPAMPKGIEDRDADVWEALLACADAAGGHWPQTARAAAVALVAQSKESTPSLGVRLLADLRLIFGDSDALSTETIIERLHGLDEAPWADLRGKPINARGLSTRLRAYDVHSRNVRLGDSVPKGYAREDLWDAWQRYLGPPPYEPATSATSATPDLGPPHYEPATSATSATPDPVQPLPVAGCSGCSGFHGRRSQSPPSRWPALRPRPRILERRHLRSVSTRPPRSRPEAGDVMTAVCAHRTCQKRATVQTGEGPRCKRCADRLPPHLRRVDTRRKTTSPAPAGEAPQEGAPT